MFIVYVCRPDVIDWMRHAGRRIGGIPQHFLLQTVPGGETFPAIRNEKLHRSSQFTFKYHDEQYTITAIVCVPLSKEIQSPECEVVDGGLNHSYVYIHLNPEKEYEYGCNIIISGKERQKACQQR